MTFFLTAFVALSGMGQSFTDVERDLIYSRDSTDIMRVLSVYDEADSLLLRKVSADVTVEMLQAPEYEVLTRRLLATVSNPDDRGVGIAAPQVGVSRRIVAVQRFDKEGKPFEIFVNPEITSRSEETRLGREGCMSIPGKRGEVERAEEITLRYIDGKTFEPREETVKGFTAVIFQHEIDHLYGKLYIDYLTSAPEEISGR